MFSASLANEKCIAVSIYDLREFAAKEIFIAFITNGIIFIDTLRANMGTITGNSKRIPWIIFVAVFAKTIVFVQTAFTNANNFAAMIENFPCFRSIIFAFLTKFAVIVIAIVAEESVGNFIAAGNTQTISSYGKSLKIVGMVVANGNFSVKVGVRPVRISSKAITAGDSIVKATLKQETVVRFVHKKLASGFPIIESFGVTRIGGSENDEGNIIASVTRTATVVITIGDVETVTGSQSRAAIVAFRIYSGRRQ